METTMTNADSTIDTARKRASEMAGTAKDYAAASAEETAEAARDDAVDSADDVVNATRAARGEFEPGSFEAKALRQIETQISNVTNRLREKPVDEMLDDVGAFARRNPLLFLGGAALAGFATMRFLKSDDADPEEHHAPDYDPWTGSAQDRGGRQ